jgi:GT2 family glycosyltransferase
MIPAMRTLIVLVNRNNRADTIDCLESLRRCQGDFDVIIADNGSTDGSLEAFADWAAGKVPVDMTASAWDGIRDQPPPCPAVTYAGFVDEAAAIADRTPRWLTVVSTGGSRGFPAGNNLGLRYGLTRDYGWFWVLNNDTIVDPQALVRLIAKMQADPGIGICASTLLFFHRPTTVQAYGGSRYFARTASSVTAGLDTPLVLPPPAQFTGFDYVVGAAMFVSRAFVEQVGLMNADLYLYFEEMDWTLRMQGRFRNGYAPDSLVYHKAGATMGGGFKPPSRHRVYYLTINRVLFTRQHFPHHVPTVVLAIMAQAAKNFVRGRGKIGWWIVKYLLYALFIAKYPLGPIP